MSVERSLIIYVSGNVPEFGGRVFLGNTMTTTLESIALPFAIISKIVEAETLAYLGDMKRLVAGQYQIDIYGKDYDEQFGLSKAIKNSIESNIVVDENGLEQKGINLMSVLELLKTTDNLTYTTSQGSFFALPLPSVFRNNVLITAGFTINATLGTIIFDLPNLATDRIRMTYKAGIVDFESINDENFITEVADEMRRHSVIMTLNTHYYERTTGKPLY